MTFASASARMQDSIFIRGGDDALWRAGGAGDGVPCKVVKGQADDVAHLGDERVILPAAVFRVRKSEIAAPAENDEVDILDENSNVVETLIVSAEPILTDKHRLVWTCEAQIKATP